MSHADEGRLHAYLDALERDAGAVGTWRDLEEHLRACDACRTLLEEARALRGRAAAILSASGPLDASAPAFQEILARRKAQTTRRNVRRLSRLTALGWAATVVLAVGVGWVARSTLDWDRASEGRPAREAPTVAAPESAPEPSQEAEATGAAAPRRAASEAAPAPEPAGAPPANVEQLAGGRGRGQPTAVTVVPPAADAAEPDAAEVQQALGGAGVEKATGVDTANRFPPTDRQRRADMAPRAVAAEAAGRVALDEAAAPEEARDPSPGDPADVPALEWRVATLDAAAGHLGAPVLALPGRPPLLVETTTRDGMPVVRLTYEVEGGDTVLVSQWRPKGGEPSREEERVAGLAMPSLAAHLAHQGNAAGTRRQGYELLAVGRIAPDRLRALLEEMR